MGYTHYWRRPANLDAARFAAWAEDVRTILASLPPTSGSAGGYYSETPLEVRGPHGTDAPDVSPTFVGFNGNADRTDQGDDMSHESFWIARDITPDTRQRPDERGWFFEFCKTARKPYDLAVCAALVRLAYHFPEGVEVSTDGEPADWSQALDLCRALFGYAALPFAPETWAA